MDKIIHRKESVTGSDNRTSWNLKNQHSEKPLEGHRWPGSLSSSGGETMARVPQPALFITESSRRFAVTGWSAGDAPVIARLAGSLSRCPTGPISGGRSCEWMRQVVPGRCGLLTPAWPPAPGRRHCWLLKGRVAVGPIIPFFLPGLTSFKNRFPEK